MQDSDEDELDENNKINPNDKICMDIIERIKFIFDILRKNKDRSVNNLAVYIDNFFHKRKIDIRVNIKALKENIKENEEINMQRNKEIKDTLEDLKYKIKGYSAKKERILNNINEPEKLEGKKLIFNEEVNKEEEKDNMIIENEDDMKENNEEEKKEEEIKEKENKDVEIKDEEIKEEEKKEEKIIGKKRLRKVKDEK